MAVMDAPVELYRDDNHKYWLGRENIPGVNEVMTALGFEQDPRYFGESCSSRGSVVHQVLAGVALGLTFDEDLLDPDLRGWVRSGITRLDYLRSKGAEILGAEEMFYHPIYKFAGQIDLRYRLGGRVCIDDWKTGAAPKTTRFKMGAYSLLIPQANGLPVQKAAVEHDRNGGNAHPVYYNEPQHFHDGNRFVAYLTTFKDLRLYAPKENKPS